MDKDNLITALQILKKKETELAEQAKEYCKDTSQPLNERWEFFLKYAPQRNHAGWIQHFDTLEATALEYTERVPYSKNNILRWEDTKRKLSYYDLIFYNRFDRRQQITVERLEETIFKLQEEIKATSKLPWLPYRPSEEDKISNEDIIKAISDFSLDKFKEECLEDYLYSYNFDW